MLYRFLVVIEESANNFSAYSPDLPGCVATGKTRHDTEISMKEAMELQIQGLLADGQPVPDPHSQTFYITVDAQTA